MALPWEGIGVSVFLVSSAVELRATPGIVVYSRHFGTDRIDKSLGR